MRKWGLFLLGFLARGYFSKAASPAVTNMVTSQRAGTKLVDIYYDAADPHGDSIDVSVVVNVDGIPIPPGMVLVPGGTNGVWIQSFYMDETEVTKQQWDEVRDWAVTNGYTLVDAEK